MGYDVNFHPLVAEGHDTGPGGKNPHAAGGEICKKSIVLSRSGSAKPGDDAAFVPPLGEGLHQEPV
jgi:hypothetical protein